MNSSLEKSLVEDYLIEKLQQKGWNYIEGEKLPRESYEEPLLIPNLIEAIKRINSDVNLTSEDINWVLNELRGKIAGAETSKKILNYLKEGVPIKLKLTKQLKYIKLIDYKELTKNEFIVSNQVTYKGRETIRADVVLYINGIPLILIECKDPTDPSVSWEDAYRQVKNYEGLVPELFKYIQFSIAAEENVRYFPSIPWLEEVETGVWREEGKTEKEAIVEMLSIEKLLDLIKNFIFIREEKGRITRVIARYMQYRAANKIFYRVIKTLEGKENKNRGLIWHWQGSGKTLTMIFTAYKLYTEELLENPTIFFILDRIELQEQIFQEIAALDLGIKPEKVETITHLKKIFLHEEGLGKRGFIITLIHKFSEAKLKDLNQFLEKTLKGKESILTRKNVIAFVDESHRTQYGILAAEMRKILKNAFFFGFTGTPISKPRKGKDTFLVFAFPKDRDYYLDKYFVKDSIKDGFTLPIAYQPRLDLLTLPRRKKVKLEEEVKKFLAQEEVEDLSELTRKVKRKLSRRKFEIIMEDPERVEEIVKDIVNHFRENVDGKFKAMIVTVSRKACVLYKRTLDKHFPSNYSDVVMTFERTDPEEISRYHKELRKKYKGKDDDDIRKEIIEKFKHEIYPKILIVTDMLLTGFDAPILQVMYLDKPLKGHRLLQAIARTNRPAKEKTAGIVVDYVGILKELNEAFSFYSRIAMRDLETGLERIEDFESEFIEKIEKLKELLGSPEIKFDDIEYLYKILTRLVLSQKEKEFLRRYKEVRKLYELIGPSEVKLEHHQFFKFLTAVHTLYIRSRGDKENKEILNRFYRRVVENIYNSIEIQEIEKKIPRLKVDEKYIEKVEKNLKTIESRTFNRLTVLRLVIKDKPRTPIYESISDRVDKIIKSWRERKVEIKKVYKELKKIFKDLIFIGERKRKLGLSDIEYSILTILEKKYKERDDLVKKTIDLYREIKSDLFTGWSFKKSVRSRVERKIKLFLIRLGKLTKKERDGLSNEILKTLQEYT